MQDLSSEDKKIPPKNYQKQPKNYPRIVFRLFLIVFGWYFFIF